ncbi:GNAT family N-acetyltransferase [Synechococcus sp. CS-1325]|uniref:MSMEG_0567/Sll0786 family nitrogen starvation N-acetyltransferase n=1 Tax=Synechococcus sp. CS-1325 TaxID=2847979 RepID=UPI000DB2B077|nr:MSMEG_0567/Sll0786 family nitrogen starvation N-acetyltransferase [Synechococcus sp. CS-1325]MCT0199576.1 GNAT family N-acetyltransferase [Synechococcus sp. CS-1325]PZV02775.1 MAG: GNAT family N-acetyltransferase [Cyanobium sp.]
MFFIDPTSHSIGRSSSSAPAAFTPSVRRGLAIDSEDFQLSPTASSERFSFHLLRSRSPLERGYWELRSAIFCQEQHLFEDSDRDGLDDRAYPIAALDHAAAQGDGVVGVVRILEEQPRLWYGGRLGVHGDYRRLNQIGKGLIWKAVTTANGWGCDRFLATVQIQNVRFFQRLHWSSIDSLEIRGIAHHLMEADLAYYRAAAERRPLLAAA